MTSTTCTATEGLGSERKKLYYLVKVEEFKQLQDEFQILQLPEYCVIPKVWFTPGSQIGLSELQGDCDYQNITAVSIYIFAIPNHSN